MRPLVALLFSLILVGCEQTPPAPLAFDEARMRLPVPGSDKSVGYFELRNNTGSDITIIKAQAENIRTIEFHTMSVVDDMMRMRRLQNFTVPAQGSVSFASGGDHLMMFGVGEIGEQIEIVFTSDAGDEYRAAFTTFSSATQ